MASPNTETAPASITQSAPVYIVTKSSSSCSIRLRATSSTLPSATVTKSVIKQSSLPLYPNATQCHRLVIDSNNGKFIDDEDVTLDASKITNNWDTTQDEFHCTPYSDMEAIDENGALSCHRPIFFACELNADKIGQIRNNPPGRNFETHFNYLQN
ncbi:hypothetical protein BC830DRAFT_1081494 [Chytriomyces sp. MP71]|nr:hypothetical protein BC830DRAFT_1081494 [Chytriomyces sp. MP71]